MWATTKTKKKQKRSTKTAKFVAKPYEPTKAERAFVAKYDERWKALRFEIQSVDDDSKRLTMATDHPNTAFAQKLLQTSLGTTSPEFADTMVKRALNVLAYKPGKIGEEEMNAVIAAIHGCAPKVGRNRPEVT